MDNSWQSLAVKRREGLRLPMQETWSGKISHAERQLSPWATATEHSRQHVFLLMGITQWGPAGSTVLEWTRRAEVFAGGRKAPYITEAGRWVRCWELMEIPFKLLQLSPFNLPLNRQACFAVIYLRIPLSELFFLVKTQRNSTQRRNMPSPLLPVHPGAPALLALLLLHLGSLLPPSTGPSPSQDTGHLLPPSLLGSVWWGGDAG